MVKKIKIDLKDIRRVFRSFVHQRRTVLKGVNILVQEDRYYARAGLCEMCVWGGGGLRGFAPNLERSLFVGSGTPRTEVTDVRGSRESQYRCCCVVLYKNENNLLLHLELKAS
jgi:hypothetical protein